MSTTSSRFGSLPAIDLASTGDALRTQDLDAAYHTMTMSIGSQQIDKATLTQAVAAAGASGPFSTTAISEAAEKIPANSYVAHAVQAPDATRPGAADDYARAAREPESDGLGDAATLHAAANSLAAQTFALPSAVVPDTLVNVLDIGRLSPQPAEARQPAAADAAAPVNPAQVGATTPEQATQAQDYTNFEMDLAHTVLTSARESQGKLTALTPDTDDYNQARSQYEDAAGVAMRERAKSQQAVEAELRAVYEADPAHAVATEDKAHEIADRYKDDPEAQQAVANALTVVKSETPIQRGTGISLYDFHRSEDALTRLKVEYDATSKLPSGYDAALADYQSKRAAVMKSLSAEFTQAASGRPNADARSDAVDKLGQDMLERYDGDDVMGQLVLSARIVQRVHDVVGKDAKDTIVQQMTRLGELMPSGTDLAIRDTVMNEPTITRIVNQYVDNAAQTATDAYNAGAAAYQTRYSDSEHRGGYVPPATAAMNKLVELTDPVNHPEVTPDITGRIINKLTAQPGSATQGTIDRIIADVSYAGDHTAELCTAEGAAGGWSIFQGRPGDEWRDFQMPDKQKIITELSLVADRAAAAAEPTGKGDGMQWSSDAAKTAVQNMANAITLRMMTNDFVRLDFNAGFRNAIAGDGGVSGSYLDQPTNTHYSVSYAGGATLALEVAHQEIRFQGKEELPVAYAVQARRSHLVADTLAAVGAGIDDFKKNTKDLFDSAHRKMSTLELTQSGYGQDMNADQTQRGINKVLKHAMLDSHDPHAVIGYGGALSDFVTGKMALDQRGYEVKRIDDMVDLYNTPADAQAGWDTEVDGTYHGDNRLMGQDGFAKVIGSRGALMSDEQVLTTVAGSSPAALAAKDKAVRASLNWGRANGFLPPAAIGPIPLPPYLQWSGDTFEHVVENKYFNYAHGPGLGRLGHSQMFTHFSFGTVGWAQLWFTNYLYHNVSFPPGQEWRKDALLAVVGGFAGMKAYQSAAIGGYGVAKGLNSLPDSMKQLIDRGNKLGNVEDFFRQHSEFVRTAGWKSVGAFGLLHADAMVWDSSRVYYSLDDWLNGKPLDQRNFWTALGNLNCDWATSYGEIKAAYGFFKFPTGTDPALREAIANGSRKLPMVEAEEAGLLFNSRLAKFGLAVAKGPGWGFDALHNIANAGLKAGLEKLGVDLGERAVFGELPGPGTLALAVWTGDDLINWIGNERQAHKLGQAVEYDFLTGAGITDDHAHILADNSLKTSGWENWLQMNSLTEGLRVAYSMLGGDPNKFVDYINSLSDNALTRLRDGLAVTKGVKGTLPESSDDDYWMLPDNPDDPVQRQVNHNLHYNDAKHRWEDTHFKMYYANGLWMSIDHPFSDQCVTYTPASHVLEHGMGNDSDAARPVQLPRSQRGIATWLLGNGLPAPVKLPNPADRPPPPLDTSRTAVLNAYSVQAGDSVWGIAGNDAGIVKWIYDHNPWLNERMERDKRPINLLGGQNPNYINAGDVIVLPDGFHPSAARG